MAKLISPLLLRFKNIPNYLNKIHIKINNNKNHLTYFNFFQLLINFIYLFKLKIEKYKLFFNKFIYLRCNYYDFYNIHISLTFYSLEYKQLKFLYENIIKMSNYINYFIKFNLYRTNYYLSIYIVKLKNHITNEYHIITSIKNFIKLYKNFKIKIIHFINSLLKKNDFNYRSTVQGIKCIYSGCLYKNSKKKSFKYVKGNISTSSIMTNITYTRKYVKTNKGIVGIKLWLNK